MIDGVFAFVTFDEWKNQKLWIVTLALRYIGYYNISTTDAEDPFEFVLITFESRTELKHLEMLKYCLS